MLTASENQEPRLSPFKKNAILDFFTLHAPEYELNYRKGESESCPFHREFSNGSNEENKQGEP